MTTASNAPTRRRSSFLEIARHIADDLHRVAEHRVAYQYDQPWKTRARSGAGRG